MNCKNCNKDLVDTQKFCDECGARVIQNRLTPKILIHQVNEEFISIDNKFLRTLLALFKKPEDVIEGFIKGVRKKYIGVITFYALSLTVLGFQMFLLQNLFPEFLESSSNAFADSFKTSNEGTKNASENFSNIINNYQGIIFSIFMPFMAIGTWLVYIGKSKHNYTEHIVINFYVAAQTILFSFVLFILFALFNFVDFLTTTFIVSVPTILYGAYVFKRLYKSSYINALLRYLAAYIIYIFLFTIILFIIGMAVAIYLMAKGNINA